MKLYVASSWRNVWQPEIVRLLRAKGHEVYDFKNPRPGDSGFHWSEIDPEWKHWNPERYRAALKEPIAERGFASDMDALRECEACILVQPCGTSAHLELGWAAGAGKRTAVFFPLDVVPASGDTMGHSMGGTACAPCGDLDGCWLPGKLKRIEPELMAKMADETLLSTKELLSWLRFGAR